MRRLVVLLGTVLTLALSGTAAADTFVVVPPSQSSGSAASGGIEFTTAQPSSPSLSGLRGIWQAAGNAYGIPWEVLAAINKVETDFGRNLGPSSAGAVGWMQFMPSTWQRWGVDANGDGIADPNNPTDAIFSAARYLAACGGQTDLAAAVYCYNHADWYVNEVLGLAAAYGQGGGAGLVSFDRLQTQLSTARTRVATAHSQLAAALVRARALDRVERRLLRKVSATSLLSDRLAAQKRAVLLGVRRDRAEARVARLRRLLHTATTSLADARRGVAGVSSAPVSVGLTGLQLGRIDQGVDLSSGLPFAALASGTVVYVDPNFWQGTPAVYEKLDVPITIGGRSYDEIYYSETKALVQTGDRLAAGQPVIEAGSAEIGFAKGNLPAAHGTYHEGATTQAGRDFYTYITGGNPGGASDPVLFQLASPLDSFQSASGGTASVTAAGSIAFSPDVVYFTR